jgi:flagellin
MIINQNMGATNANRMANVNSSNAAKAMKQLSSGLRINSAADDAAGLSISEKMKGQINGLNQAISNAQTGVSLVQTADGALSETTSQLQRMRELAAQASSDTNTTADRAAMQIEATQISAQIDNIGNTTQFNTKNLLDGESGVKVTSVNNVAQNIQGTADTKSGTITLNGSTDVTLAAQATVTGAKAGGTLINAGTTLATSMVASTIGIGGINYSFTAADTVQGALDKINADSATHGVVASFTVSSGLVLKSVGSGSSSGVNITAAGTGDLLDAANLKVSNTKGTDISLNAAGQTAVGGSYQAAGNHITMTSGNYQGLSFDMTSASDETINVASNNSIQLQIGANVNQGMSISINDMRSTALGVAGVDLTTQAGAQAALDKIDTATATVSTQRAQLGAYQNRLTSTITNLGTTSQNLTAAQSAITDVDMAATMAEYSKDNVEAQAAQAMIAQANQQPSQVLSLLR